jgi:thiamine biosynthesis lipoprotein
MRVVAGALVLLFTACAASEPERRAFVFEGPTMGTVYQVKVARRDLPESRRAELEAAIRRELESVDAVMSTYREDSELSRFNHHAETTPFPLSDATWEVLATALEVSRLSGGALDVTVGPLVDAWGFGPGPEPAAPSAAELAAILERVGYDKIELTGDPRAVRKTRADVRCDLSAVAKGYAVDRVAETLAALGESDFMVEVGGEVRAAGRNDRGQVWRIGVERPQMARGTVARGTVQRIVPLGGAALATSGDYRNYREVDGERISHLMDPRTGRPVGHRLASVSVVHPRCAVADAWATALIVLGPDEGFEVAAREGLAVLFLVREDGGFHELATPAFERDATENHR